MSTAQQARERRLGLAAGVAAYGLWGLFPIYLKLLSSVPALEVLSHRVVWALGFLALLAARRGLLGPLRQAFRGRVILVLAASSVAIAANWLVYIWSVQKGRILESSLGYFINPLVNVLLGVLVFKERLDRPVVLATGLATLGVGWMTLQSGGVPWIALALASLFGGYGVLRKLAPVGAVVGLVVETLLLAPLALVYLAWSSHAGTLTFLSHGRRLDVLLALSGPVTAVPLLLFVGAARRLPLSILGFLQYLSPSLQFLLAVFVYGEPISRATVMAFSLIWSGLAVLVARSLRASAPV
jgi:chloramphenicol-sensitive protein RarD